MMENYLIPFPTLYVFSNFDFQITFVTTTAGFSLATYPPLTFKPFKQGITIKWVLQLQ